MADGKARGAVIIGAHVNGLGIARSLARLGVPLAIVSTRPFDVAQYSRTIGERHELAVLHERHQALVEFLEDHAERWRGWALFSSHDDSLTILARNHERLSRSYCLPVQPWEQIRALVDKDGMHELAVAAGLDVPLCYGPATTATVDRSDVAYPALVKPIQHDRLISRFGTKLFVANDRTELARACECLAEAELAGLVYEMIPGADDCIYVDCLYMDRHGEPVAGVTVRKLRQNPPGVGGARVVVVVDDVAEMREASVALLRRAGYRGLAFVEYKRDPRSGRCRFIEVNPRAVLFNSALVPTGVDLVALTWRDFVLGEESLRTQANGWRGAWIHLQADIGCSIVYRRQESLTLRDFLAPYRQPKTYAVWSLADPMPFVVQSLRTARDGVKAVALRAGLRRRSEPAVGKA